jgi:hypothetical protein
MSNGKLPPEPLRQFVERAGDALCCVELVAVFVSPRVLARAHRIPGRDEMLEHLDAYLDLVEDLRREQDHEGNRRLVRSAPYARTLREQFSVWMPGPEIPMEIMTASRGFIEAMAGQAPPGGWDEFEGFTAKGW